VYRLLSLLVAVLLLVVLGLAILANYQPTIPLLGNIRTSSLAIMLVIAMFVIGLVLLLHRERFSRVMISALAWAAIVAVIAVGYTYRFDLRDVAERVMAELVPGYASGRSQTVWLVRGGNGNFALTAQVNNAAHISMILDTGASSVVLTQEAAKAAGLSIEALAYTVSVDTANGRTRAAPVTLDSVAVGGIVERAVPALVAQPGQLRTNLLGMSFLNRLESWEVRGDRLVLRGRP
jgi:aspartyl protease family protein